jgi:urease accessory protein
MIIPTTMSDASELSYPWLARLLQVSDSAFPTGGYAHSSGFEQIVRLGLVHDETSLASYIDNHHWPMLIHFELPVVRFARDAALQEGTEALETLISLDTCVAATKTARESRDASCAMGRRRLHAFRAASPSPILSAFAKAVDEQRTPAHHSIIFGTGLAQLPQQAVLMAWAFQSLSSLCLSAPKLLRIGQDAVQRVLTAALASVVENIALSLLIGREEAGWFDPLLELASMEHEIAHERLFIS